MSYCSNIFIKRILLIINRTTKGYFYYSKDSIILGVMSGLLLSMGRLTSFLCHSKRNETPKLKYDNTT